MSALLAVLTAFATTIIVPFLIQLLKREQWKAGKAKLLAFVVSAVCAALWVMLTGAAGSPDGAGIINWVGWLLGSIATVFGVATVIYRWFEEKIFNHVPNLARILMGKK